MGDSAEKLPPLPDQEPRIEEKELSVPVVKHADATFSGQERISRSAKSPSAGRRYSLTMFPQRIENASQVSLFFILMGVFGFAIGVGLMILMLL